MLANWHRDFFRGIALEMWRRATPPNQTRIEADFLEAVLQCPKPARVLDVPCGNGRHSIELARRGLRVTGVDASEEFIAEARVQAEESLSAEFKLGDMRDLPWKEQFDGGFCLGNSFCYLAPESDAPQFLKGIFRSLRSGARFVVETGMVAESILPSLQKGRWHRLGDLYMLSENRYEVRDSRLDIEYTFIQNGKAETRPSSSYVITVGELCRLHAYAGLQPLELFGSFSKDPYQLGSPRLILVSEKKTPAPQLV